MKRPLLETILDPSQLSVRFQPIFHIGKNPEIYSLEALIRGPRGTHFEQAGMLFDYVRRKRAEAEVDRSCLQAIFDEVQALPDDLRINVNVHACTLSERAGYVDFFRKETKKRGLVPERFVVEIVEHAPSCNLPELMQALQQLRDCGVHIALDDVGLGQSNYQMMLDCDPDYFKVDAYFIRGLARDSRRHAVVQSVIALAKAMDGSVVAEGCEAEEDLAEVRRLGIDLLQSNLLCPALPLDNLLENGLLGPFNAPLRVANETALRTGSAVVAG